MVSEWREIFDAGLQTRLRDEVWKLLPDSLICKVAFEPKSSELLITIEHKPDVRYWMLVSPFAPPRQIRGFRFVLPPLASWEAREWMDQTESKLASIVGSIREHLPAIIEELTGDAPSRNAG